MRIVNTIPGLKNVSVTTFMDPILDRAELQNVTPKNAFKVGAAITRRRFARECETKVVAVEVHHEV